MGNKRNYECMDEIINIQDPDIAKSHSVDADCHADIKMLKEAAFL